MAHLVLGVVGVALLGVNAVVVADVLGEDGKCDVIIYLITFLCMHGGMPKFMRRAA